MCTLVWPVELYGCEIWTLKAADRRRITAFETTAYRRMLRISWRKHRTNVSILEELQPKRRFQYKAGNWNILDTLHERVAWRTSSWMDVSTAREPVVDLRDVGQKTLRNGWISQLQTVLGLHKTEELGGDWWSRLHGLRPSGMRRDRGKAMWSSKKFVYCMHN